MFWVPLLLCTWVAALATCVRLCVAAAAAATAEKGAADGPPPRGGLTLPEAAFLCGGPSRVAELTLVSLHARRRVLLAHTGWTSVAVPHGDDDLERAAIAAAGREGQCRTHVVRDALAGSEAVRALADRLVGAGLAMPADARHAVTGAVAALRVAGGVVLTLGLFAALVLPLETAERGRVALWFSLPLLLVVGALAIARMEVHPYTRWATDAGLRLVRGLPDVTGTDGSRTGPDQALLAAVAVSGTAAIPDLGLRAALAGARTA
ncbi:TIGR04222 domain-containing membrane protein [Streptomyces sp. NPDC058657]|uniref:TIGR04222 domain-containing membrane protein n=1 Tax=unclassified Streptomyces TaxID=2593676 RepID=UPI00365693D7